MPLSKPPVNPADLPSVEFSLAQSGGVVKAKLADGDYLVSDRMECLLLYQILQELKRQ